ncbi:MAG: LysE/ArgO family amino acid transporter [Actinomycetota bacterium]
MPLLTHLPATSVGYVTGLTLIVAIGAQNAFVLRQGLRREHVTAIVAVCSLSDALLITCGVAGLGVLVATYPVAVDVARYGGAAFLMGYGLLAARRALRPQAMRPSDGPTPAVGTALLACLAFTFLNPQVYLDTIVVLGSLANQHGDPGRWAFAVGASAASITWFVGLGYGARSLSRFFAKPAAWRVLDGLIAAVMLAIAGALLLSPR